jgi:hypothetical protein
VFGTAAGVTTFDFEITAPVPRADFMTTARTAVGPPSRAVLQNQGLCIKYVQTGK